MTGRVVARGVWAATIKLVGHTSSHQDCRCLFACATCIMAYFFHALEVGLASSSGSLTIIVLLFMAGLAKLTACD